MNAADMAAAAAALQQQIQQAVVAALAAHAAVLDAPVAQIAVKLPDFLGKDPQMLFSQAEAQFRRACITQPTTMYDHVLGQTTVAASRAAPPLGTPPGQRIQGHRSGPLFPPC
jgi:hypothetical protein